MLTDTFQAPVQNAWALAGGVTPFLDGRPLDPARAIALYYYLTGAMPADFSARPRRNSGEAAALDLEQHRADEDVLRMCRAYFSIVLGTFGEIPGVELRAADGSLLDVETLQYLDVDQVLNSGAGRGFRSHPPALR